MEQFTECIKDLLMCYSVELCKHTLKTKMTPDEVMALVLGQPVGTVSAKSTPAQKEATEEWDGDIGDLPSGISEKRARVLLALAHAGVPEGQKIHTKKKCLFKPNKQHAKFYENGCFSGPDEDRAVIDWLVELAGDVGPPPEPEVEAQLPAKWDGDKKKAANLLALVDKHKKAATKDEPYKYINWESSRGREPNDDTLVYDDEFEICGTKSNKAEFLNLIAWYKEHPDVAEAKPKVTKATKGKAPKKVEKSEDDEEKSSENVEEKKEQVVKGARTKVNGRAAQLVKAKAKIAKVEEESDEELDLSEESSADEAPESADGKPDSDADVDDKLFVKGYDEAKLKKLRAKLEDVLEGEYVNMDNFTKLKNTKTAAAKFTFNDPFQIAIPKSWNEEQVVKMMEEC